MDASFTEIILIAFIDLILKTRPMFWECLQYLYPSYKVNLNTTLQESCGPQLRKKQDVTPAARMIPPEILTPPFTNDPLPASKTVWILHPNHNNIVVEQGKSGVGWKSKSKLGS